MKKSKSKSSFRGKTKKNAESRKRGSNYGYLKIPKGTDVFAAEADSKVEFDIMPYLVKDKNHPDKDAEAEIAIPGSYWYKRPFKTHRNIGSGNDTFVCLASFGKKCPICEYREKLRKEGGDDDEIKALRPSDRNLYAIIIKNNKKLDDQKVHLFDFSDYLFQEKFEEQLSDTEPEKFEVFPDHKEGYTVRVRFSEENLGGNKYAAPSRFDFVDRKEQYEDEILDKVPCLDDCLTVLSYDELKARFLEIVDDEEEEEEKPVRKGKKHVKPEPDEEEEEEEEEKPARKRKTKVEPKKPAAKASKTIKTSKELTCPYKHKFGIDTDKFDDCEDCELWNECYTKKKSKK